MTTEACESKTAHPEQRLAPRYYEQYPGEETITLREFLTLALKELSSKVDKGFDHQERAIQIAITAQRELSQLHADAHAREHTAAAEARTRADAVIEDKFRTLQTAQDKFESTVVARFDKTNEWRGMVEDQQSTFTRTDFVASELRRVEATIDRVDEERSKATAVNSERVASLEKNNVIIQTQIAELVTISRDVRDLREYRSTAQGKGAILAVVSSAIVAIMVSVMTALIVYSVTR